MNNTLKSVYAEMILQDAKKYADKGDNLMAIKLWRYSITFEKNYQEIENEIEKRIRKKIRDEIKIKVRRTTK